MRDRTGPGRHQDGRNRTASFGVSDGVFAPGLLCAVKIEILIEPFLSFGALDAARDPRTILAARAKAALWCAR